MYSNCPLIRVGLTCALEYLIHESSVKEHFKHCDANTNQNHDRTIVDSTGILKTDEHELAGRKTLDLKWFEQRARNRWADTASLIKIPIYVPSTHPLFSLYIL